MKTIKLFPMNLQFFAEPEPGADGGQAKPAGTNETPPAATDDETDEKEEETKGKAFSRDDVAKMMAAEKAKWQKEQDAKQQEADRLAKMNDAEKAEHEKQKLLDKIADLERKDNLRAMSKEASKMLTEQNLPYDDDLLDLIVNEDADKTKANVSVVLAFAAKLKKENARQKTPPAGGKFDASTSGEAKSIASLAEEVRIIKN